MNIGWRSTSAAVVESFWSWGNMAALPQEIQDKIEVTTRENLKPYEQDGGYSFPYEVLLGNATKP